MRDDPALKSGAGADAVAAGGMGAAMSMDSVTELYAKAAYEGRGKIDEALAREPSEGRSRLAIGVLCVGLAANAALPVAGLWALVEIAGLR